jgi:ketosteroid isomerase-like protein
MSSKGQDLFGLTHPEVAPYGRGPSARMSGREPPWAAPLFQREHASPTVPLALGDTARAMSQENVELYRRCVDAFNRRDLNAFLALMDDDVEAVSRLDAIEGGLRGHDGIRRWWESWFDVWPDYEIEVVGVRDLGDVTLANLRALGHGAGSDVPFEDRAWQLARWRHGKCVLWRVFNNRAEALEAAGLSEPDAHADS